MGKLTVQEIIERKKQKLPLVVLTAYDATVASILEQCEVDIILVGDSLGMVILGYDSTTPVTMGEMLHHTKAVKRGALCTFLIADMPFMSYHITPEETLRNAGRFLQEGGCDAVKIEWHPSVIPMVSAMVKSGIPVMGHVGLTPQTASTLGGYKVQGKSAGEAKEIFSRAEALQKAGCFSIVLECVPDRLAELITQHLAIPTIGIGAGIHCDGQVLVISDLLGLFDRFVPRFVKKYSNLKQEIIQSVKSFQREVRSNVFPDREHSFTMEPQEFEKLKTIIT